MKKTIISSVVFILIISKPLVLNVEVFAYEILKSNSKYVNGIDIIRKSDEENDDMNSIDDVIGAVDVDELVAGLESNTRKINGLLKEKKTIVEKVQAAMDLRASMKTRLSNDQIDQFQEFSSCYQTESETIKVSLEKILENDLISVKNEMLHTKSNFKHIFDELSAIATYQFEAIYSLKSIISSGTKTLAVL